MPGPLSNPTTTTMTRKVITDEATGKKIEVVDKIITVPIIPIKKGKHVPGSPNGKTRHDKASGKHARRLANRKSDPIRNGGGKQFASKKKD